MHGCKSRFGTKSGVGASGSRPRGPWLAAFLAACGVFALYATARAAGNGADAPAAQREPATGSFGAYIAKPVPEATPAVRFLAGDGREVGLEAWRGKVVLLNLWATWCVPCRKEMPALDRLQAAVGSPDFEVVALSIDHAGLVGSRKFLDTAGVKTLKLYADPTARLANTFKAAGLPTTLVIDRQGREIGRLTGPAEWDSPEAQALIQKVIAAR